MKKISNVKDLQKGQRIIKVTPNFEVSYFEFIMIHPHNEKYILALDMLADGVKIYIPYLYDSYFTDFTDNDIDYLKFQKALWEIDKIRPLIQKHSDWKKELIDKFNKLMQNYEKGTA